MLAHNIAMVYLVGFIGFVCGFAAGLMVLHFLLRHRSRRELVSDDSLKWKFGLLCWGIAVLGAYSFVQMYGAYFGP